MSDQRKPWIKWYTRDWRANVPLRMCSYAARGLWADLLTLMAESRQHGFLLVEGVVPTARQLAGLLGGTEREIAKLLAELRDANVYSVVGEPMPADVEGMICPDLPAGVILSRRMVRDKAKADRDRDNGKAGGNPYLPKKDNQGVNPKANPQRSEARGKPPSGVSPHESETSPPVAARGSLEGSAHDAKPILATLTSKLRATQ